MKTILKLAAGLIVGIAILIGGVVALTQDEVTCGGTTMSAGDLCEETSRGGKTTMSDYEDQRSDGQTGKWIAVGLGSLIIVVFGLGVIGTLTTDRQSRSQ